MLIGPGSKELMFSLQLVLKGYTILPTPCWVSYAPQAKILNRKIIFIQTKYEDSWQLLPEQSSPLKMIAEGFSYIRTNPVMLGVIVVTVIANMLLFPFVLMVPVFARDVLEIGPGLMGVLMAADGFGSMIGAVYLASRDPRDQGKIFVLGTTVAMGLVLGFSFSTVFGFSLLILFLEGLVIAGFGTMQSAITLTVTPVNDMPEDFTLLYPTISDTFSTHVDNDTAIAFSWHPSVDIDSEVSYKLTIELEYFGNTYTDIHENISDTTIGVSSNSLDPILEMTSQDETVITYWVHASDDEYNVASDVGEFGLSRAALGAVDGYAIPEQFSLHQNYPNPFNPVTTLRYDLPENSLVTITIYDMLGRQVKTLINQTQDAGYKSVIWNATNDYDKPVSAGIYLYQIQAGEYISTKKMVLLK